MVEHIRDEEVIANRWGQIVPGGAASAIASRCRSAATNSHQLAERRIIEENAGERTGGN